MIQIPGAFVELDDTGEWIEVYFPYDPQSKDRVKAIPGKKFIDKNNPLAAENGVHWRVPADIYNARKLREIFGRNLTMGNAVKAWARQEVQLERNLKGLAIADDAELKRLKPNHIISRIINGEPIPELKLSKKNPLSKKRKPRPYQRADIAMMAQANVINANQPGIGKTLERIGSVVEAALDKGPHLVVAPRTSLVNTWKVEIERLQPGVPVFTSENATERRRQIERGLALAAKGEPCWILVIFDDVRVKRDVNKPKLEKLVEEGHLKPEGIEKLVKDSMKKPLYARKDHKGSTYLYLNEQHKRLVGIKWKSVTIDEFHRSGLNTSDSLFTLGVDMLECENICPMSGTPMGGKPIKLFPVLHRIDPEHFSSKWRWAGEWLEIENNGYGKKIGKIKPGREDDFYDYHARYMVRRLKREALPGLPPKVIEFVYCDMTPAQKEQYEKFDDDAEVVIESERGPKLVVGDCILAEFTRLRQFANAFCTINSKGQIIPTEDSSKLPVLLEKLDEFGLRKHDFEPGSRAIIASQHKRMVDMVAPWLRKRGIPCDALTGDTKDSKPIIDKFKDLDADDQYVIIMTTQTGGVSLNLGEANSIHVLDEDWNPDNDEQLEDRGDRGERTTPLVCVYYRTRYTIQDYVARVAEGKKITNANALDVFRMIAKERELEEAA